MPWRSPCSPRDIIRSSGAMEKSLLILRYYKVQWCHGESKKNFVCPNFKVLALLILAWAMVLGKDVGLRVSIHDPGSTKSYDIHG